MTDVAGVLLDHVPVDPPQGHLAPTLADEGVVQGGGGDGLAGQLPLLVQAEEVLLGRSSAVMSRGRRRRSPTRNGSCTPLSSVPGCLPPLQLGLTVNSETAMCCPSAAALMCSPSRPHRRQHRDIPAELRCAVHRGQRGGRQGRPGYFRAVNLNPIRSRPLVPAAGCLGQLNRGVRARRSRPHQRGHRPERSQQTPPQRPWIASRSTMLDGHICPHMSTQDAQFLLADQLDGIRFDLDGNSGHRLCGRQVYLLAVRRHGETPLV